MAKYISNLSIFVDGVREDELLKKIINGLQLQNLVCEPLEGKGLGLLVTQRPTGYQPPFTNQKSDLEAAMPGSAETRQRIKEGKPATSTQPDVQKVSGAKKAMADLLKPIFMGGTKEKER